MRYIVCLLFICLTSSLYAQDEAKTIVGTITFVTSNNVYVKFDSTEEIKIDSTLKFSNSDCLLVTNKSSTSIVCSIIDNCSINVGDTVTYSVSISDESINDEKDSEIDKKEIIPAEIIEIQPTISDNESIYYEKIRGRISVASYNTFSEVREDRHRLRTQFSINADHISDSKFSIETYLAYRNIITPSGSNYNGRTNVLNVYNLNVRFDATPSLSATIGRNINTKASSLGAIDGLQVEKYFGNIYVGAIGGFRPDFTDYGFNSDLLQYGGYAGIETNTKDFYSQTTLGAIEQTNSGATDRRYIYFQHYSTIASNLNLFSSIELDIFGNSSNNTRLTNFYLSARYRFSRAVNLMVSYDSRKQIIYYETFQTDIEQLLNDDLARQGIRIRLNVRPTKTLWAGISYSNRFQNDSENKSNNIYGYITLSKIPKIDGRLNVSYNMNSSNYLESNISSIRYSRDFVKNKLNANFYFRRANYTYENRDRDFNQNYYGMGVSYRMSRTWQFSISGESSKFEDENNYRFYTRLTKRFYSKKKSKKG